MKFINGMFCGSKARTNEEYRAFLKTKNKWYLFFAFLGIAMAVSAYVAFYLGIGEVTDYMLGVYCGFGFGLCIGFVARFIKNMMLLRDEEKLKADRLKNTDERLEQIGDKALRTTTKVLLIVLLVGGMIGGLFDQVLVKALLVLIWVYCITYIIAFHVYQRKM